MKTQIWVYIVVAVLSVGAGVAIAGVPDTSPREPTIVPPTTTEAPETTVPATTSPDPEPDETTTTVSTTEAPQSTTTEPAETTTTLPELPDRSEVAVVVQNAANIAGIAGDTADLLLELGYASARPLDGTLRPDSVVFYRNGAADDLVLNEQLAVRLGADLFIAVSAPLSELADPPDLRDDEVLVVVLGEDRG